MGLRISHDWVLRRLHIDSIVRVMPNHRHAQSDLKLVHLVFMSTRVQLSSDIGLFLAELLLK